MTRRGALMTTVQRLFRTIPTTTITIGPITGTGMILVGILLTHLIGSIRHIGTFGIQPGPFSVSGGVLLMMRAPTRQTYKIILTPIQTSQPSSKRSINCLGNSALQLSNRSSVPTSITKNGSRTGNLGYSYRQKLDQLSGWKVQPVCGTVVYQRQISGSVCSVHIAPALYHTGASTGILYSRIRL